MAPTEMHMTNDPPASESFRGCTAARLAIGVVALHVVDDSFLQPNPGTSAGDHLAGGLIPLAALVTAGALYGRLRPGARSATALLAGFFGVLGGTEAVHYSRAGGPSGDDYTGLLSIVAGLVLLGIGGATLWTSRRRDDRLRRRYGRRALLAVGGVFFAGALLFPVSVAYVITHVGRATVPPDALGVPHEDVRFTTSDGLTLQGWYIPSRNGAAVISFPGRASSQERARLLARHGYGVLLFDRRGEGESDGDPNLLGWQGERDIHAAVAFLQRRPDVDPHRIGGIGLSVGGEMMIEAAAESPALKAIVTEASSRTRAPVGPTSRATASPRRRRRSSVTTSRPPRSGASSRGSRVRCSSSTANAASRRRGPLIQRSTRRRAERRRSGRCPSRGTWAVSRPGRCSTSGASSASSTAPSSAARGRRATGSDAATGSRSDRRRRACGVA
jgi:X-Pro dipeptidyl-peptidase-like protein